MLQTRLDRGCHGGEAASACLHQGGFDLAADVVRHFLVNVLIHQCLSETRQDWFHVLSLEDFVSSNRLESRCYSAEERLVRIRCLRVWVDGIELNLIVTLIEAFKNLVLAAKVLLHFLLQVDLLGRFIFVYIDTIHGFFVDLVGDSDPVAPRLRRCVILVLLGLILEQLSALFHTLRLRSREFSFQIFACLHHAIHLIEWLDWAAIRLGGATFLTLRWLLATLSCRGGLLAALISPLAQLLGLR
mmetsp:Transcript_11891/g.15145  ORF Transcript_11891/g.15145 Transcript_11891/m.15145 type:complete len:244 (-) Transcript_11891:525-1256(-)